MPNVYKVPVLTEQFIAPNIKRLEVAGDRVTPLLLREYQPEWLGWATPDPFTGDLYTTQGNWTLSNSPYLFHQDYSFATGATPRLRELIAGIPFECFDNLTIEIATEFTANVVNTSTPPVPFSEMRVLCAVTDLDSWNGTTYTNVIGLHTIFGTIDNGPMGGSHAATVNIGPGRWQIAGNISILMAENSTIGWDADVSFTITPDKIYPIIERAWITSDPGKCIVGVAWQPRQQTVPVAAFGYTGYQEPEWIEFVDYWSITNSATVIYDRHEIGSGALTPDPSDWRSTLLTHDFAYPVSPNSCFEQDIINPEVNYYDDKQYECDLTQSIGLDTFQSAVRTGNVNAIVVSKDATAGVSCTLGSGTNHNVTVYSLDLPATSDPLVPSGIVMLAPLAYEEDEPPPGTTTYVCDCPDFTRRHGAIIESKWPSEKEEQRNWADSDAGSPGDCKHIIAVRIYRGEQVNVPIDLPLEYMSEIELHELERLKQEEPDWNPFRY